MKNPIIAIDVSKDSSHAQLFESYGNPLGKTFVFDHDMRGFEMLRQRLDDLRKKTGKEVMIALEPTGLYHLPIVRWCSEQKIRICPIPPLESAKLRKAKIRPTKTDSLDCTNIANACFAKDGFTDLCGDCELMWTARRYERTKRLEIKTKCMFMSCFDVVFPTFANKFGTPYSDKWLCVFAKYGHPDTILSAGKAKVAEHIEKMTCHSRLKSLEYADEIIDFCKGCMPGCDPDSSLVEELKEYAESISGYEKKASMLIDAMRKRIGPDAYGYIRNVLGFKEEKLLTLILAEIGNISRFKSAGSLVSYAGLDPAIYQSGEMTGKGLHITKKGNSLLRKYLYLAVRLIIANHKDSSISKFYEKKKSGGKTPKVALVACCGKLLRLIHAALTLKDKFVRSDG